MLLFNVSAPADCTGFLLWLLPSSGRRERSAFIPQFVHTSDDRDDKHILGDFSRRSVGMSDVFSTQHFDY